eukprot:1638800-Amphidinium_carterae.1
MLTAICKLAPEAQSPDYRTHKECNQWSATLPVLRPLTSLLLLCNRWMQHCHSILRALSGVPNVHGLQAPQQKLRAPRR